METIVTGYVKNSLSSRFLLPLLPLSATIILMFSMTTFMSD